MRGMDDIKRRPHRRRLVPTAINDPQPVAATEPETPKPKLAETNPTKPHRHRRILVVALVSFVLLGLGGGGLYLVSRPAGSSRILVIGPSPTTAPSPTPLTAVSPLTGKRVDPAIAAQPIVGVVIENHPDARPQSGLADAGVVYEANAEGGITRFLAFYLDTLPASLGPVRSLRTYFVDWGLEFNSPVAHAGGNQDALDLVKPLGLKDLNALSGAANSFFRTTDRVAPHNLYTSNTKLTSLLKQFGYTGPADFVASPRQADAPAAGAQHPKIHIEFSYSGYQVDYAYDAASNDYARNMAGTPHLDRNTGQQIHVKNIVIEMMPTSYGVTRIGEQTVIMQTIGKGKGWVIRDGNAIPVTWSKTSRTNRTQLLDDAGKDVPLDAGNTWYEIVPSGNTVSI